MQILRIGEPVAKSMVQKDNYFAHDPFELYGLPSRSKNDLKTTCFILICLSRESCREDKFSFSDVLACRWSFGGIFRFRGRET